MTTPDQLRDIVHYLQQRVRHPDDDERAIVFEPPNAEQMIADGLDADAAGAVTAATWWSEMVDDVIETPDFADPSDGPAVVLEYARDVIQEYIWKRFDLES